MSVARLAALAARGGAPLGRPGTPDTSGAPPARPPFDPIAALDSAAPLPAAPLAQRPAALPTLPGAASPPAMQAAPAAARMTSLARESWTAAPDAGPPVAADAATPPPPRPFGPALHPGPTPHAMPAGDAPADADPIVAASPLRGLAMPPSPPQDMAPVQTLPAASSRATAPRLDGPEATRREAVIAAPLPSRQDDAAATPPWPIAEITPPASAPTVSIGRLEVVVAPPVREPAQQPPPRPPRRGFDAYAAIRAARDRAW